MGSRSSKQDGALRWGEKMLKDRSGLIAFTAHVALQLGLPCVANAQAFPIAVTRTSDGKPWTKVVLSEFEPACSRGAEEGWATHEVVRRIEGGKAKFQRTGISATYCQGQLVSIEGQIMPDDLQSQSAAGQLVILADSFITMPAVRPGKVTTVASYAEQEAHIVRYTRPRVATPAKPNPVARAPGIGGSARASAGPLNATSIADAIVRASISARGGRRGNGTGEYVVPNPLGGDLWHITRTVDQVKCSKLAQAYRCAYREHYSVLPSRDSTLAQFVFVGMKVNGENESITDRVDDFIQTGGAWTSPTILARLQQSGQSSSSSSSSSEPPWAAQERADKSRREINAGLCATAPGPCGW